MNVIGMLNDSLKSSLLLVVSSLIFFGCSGKDRSDQKITPGDSLKKHDFSTTVKPLKYAGGFGLSVSNGVKSITIFNGFQDRRDTLSYVLVKKGEPVPKGYEQAQVIRTPIKTIGTFATTHIGYLSQLGYADSIVGVATPEIINAPSIRKRLNQGGIADFGSTFNPNLEVIMEKSPDLIFLTVLPATKFTQYQTLINAGIPVIVVAEWLENTPLGRAEWLKLFAAILGKDDLGEKRFLEIEHDYLKLKSVVAADTTQPKVMSGLPFKDAWFLPAGESYMASLFKDAAADYQWKNTSGTGSLNLGMEAIYPVALKSEYWINTGTVKSMKELVGLDSRYKEFLPVKSDRVFNNNKLLNEYGGNAYWEYGVCNPHLILEDLIRIFHPDVDLSSVTSSDTLHFYRKLK